MNGRHFSQLGRSEVRGFEGCLRDRVEGRTTEVLIVLMKRSLWLKKSRH